MGCLEVCALLYFLKGSTLLYAGQEYRDTHQPSLFEQEPIVRDASKDISPYLKKNREYHWYKKL